MVWISRRTFLGTAVTGASALLLPVELWSRVRPVGLDPARLGALADAVLPSHLGEGGRAEVAGPFLSWVAGYRPGAEMSHGYGSDSMEIRRLPPDPTERWSDQLSQLDELARARFAGAYRTLSRERRQSVAREAVAAHGDSALPTQPEQATHVATALMAFWFRSSAAWNQALGARVDKGHARSLESAPQRPAPLPEGAR